MVAAVAGQLLEGGRALGKERDEKRRCRDLRRLQLDQLHAGIATTWGAEPWKDRVPTRDAWVVAALERAGAVLVGKSAVGALAYGDIWFGGTCRNPWNPEQGS
ncbi:MAG: amidase family protein, partial [Phycisphaerales bacterium]